MKLDSQHREVAGAIQFPPSKGGGPIEAGLSTPRPGRGSASFHRRKAVAPLKRACTTATPSRISSFHRRKAVAPLKLLVAAHLNPRHDGFHRRKAVAPLKHRHRREPSQHPPSFHRRKAVAPLKPAVCRLARRRGANGFHRRKAVAPLKRDWRTHQHHRPGLAFPPSKGGGPIEASTGA